MRSKSFFVRGAKRVWDNDRAPGLKRNLEGLAEVDTFIRIYTITPTEKNVIIFVNDLFKELVYT